MSDVPEKVAFLEGSIGLAGLSDNNYGLTKNNTFQKLCKHTYSTFPWQQSTYITRNQEKETIFMPLYDITDKTYTIYWTKKIN